MDIITSIAGRMPPKVKRVLSPLYASLASRWALSKWEKAGRPCPPPAAAKHMIIKHYARLFDIDAFVETGTYKGNTVNAMRAHFAQIYSIELSPTLYHEAAKRFAKHAHIRILQGDSGAVLPRVLRQIDRPALFWLDAHETGGEDTARGDISSPVAEEMAAILSHHVRNHVILIDDVPEFSGEKEGIPALDVFREDVLRQRPGWTFEVEDNIIRIHPSHHREDITSTADVFLKRGHTR